jgi:hypothetical protein
MMKTATAILVLALCGLHAASHAGGVERPVPSRAATGVDRTLDKFKEANKGNPAAMKAIQKAAAAIKAEPEKYMGTDGKLDLSKITSAIEQSLGSMGKITVPSDLPASEGKDSSPKGSVGQR